MRQQQKKRETAEIIEADEISGCRFVPMTNKNPEKRKDRISFRSAVNF